MCVRVGPRYTVINASISKNADGMVNRVDPDQKQTYFYFIFSSEIMENISVIKVVSIYSEMIWYHFTVD